MKARNVKRINKLMEQLDKGQIVHMEIRRSDVGDERIYWLEPSHKPVGEWTVKKAVELGLVRPMGDALFPELGNSQTYKAVLA